METYSIPTDTARIGLIIKSVREEKTMTQRQLAEKSGVARGYLSRLEVGEFRDLSFTLGTLIKLSFALQYPLDKILSRAGVIQPPDVVSKIGDKTYHYEIKKGLTPQESRDAEQFVKYIKSQRKKK